LYGRSIFHAKLADAAQSGLADLIAAAIGTAAAAIGANYGWNQQGVEKEQGSCEDQ